MDEFAARIPDALAATAQRRQEGAEPDRKPEDRLRTLLGREMERPGVCVVREWSPPEPMESWPQVGKGKLGGFDLAVIPVGDDTPMAVVETKWSKGGLVDALDEVPWDLFKVANAVATIPVACGLLVYAAHRRAWEKPPRFVNVFQGVPATDTRQLINDHRDLWEWLRRHSARSEPTRLPARIATVPTGEASLEVSGEEWLIKAAQVLPPDGDW